MIKNFCLDVINAIATIISIIGIIYLLMILPGCQFLESHPKLVEDVEEVGEKILDFEIAQIAKSSSIHSSLQANHAPIN